MGTLTPDADGRVLAAAATFCSTLFTLISVARPRGLLRRAVAVLRLAG
jgi:hypothetical protein